MTISQPPLQLLKAEDLATEEARDLVSVKVIGSGSIAPAEDLDLMSFRVDHVATTTRTLVNEQDRLVLSLDCDALIRAGG